MASKIPQDLIDYLHTMIIPDGGESLIILENLENTDFISMPDNHFHGAIVRGTPTPEQSEQLSRVLRPGAHCLLIAPDHQPTGHDGACNLEDTGFEIRDSIAWIRKADDDFWYTSKAATAERNAGMGVEDGWVWYFDKDQTLTDENEELIRGILELEDDEKIPEYVKESQLTDEIKPFFPTKKWETNPVRCLHPTIKPVKIMENLLDGVPKDQGPILDPFLGSGTTGIAALRTGHDFIGIEKNEEYLGYADKRIKHWDRESRPWGGTKIESDVEAIKKEDEEISLDDLFGL